MNNPHAKYDAVLHDNIEHNGSELEATIAMEELAELIQAVSKVKRYGCTGIYKENLIEEIADTRIVIDELMMIFGISDDEYQNEKDAKVRRLKERMSAE